MARENQRAKKKQINKLKQASRCQIYKNVKVTNEVGRESPKNVKIHEIINYW